MSTPNAEASGAREAARQQTGQFGTQPLAEAPDVELVTPPAPAGPKRLRSLTQVREDEAFLAAMEAVEREARVLELNKGDWVREFGDDEYGIVKSVGSKTLTTDAWRDEDTDYGDHVVAVVDKESAEAVLADHGVIPTRAQNAYAKRRAAAIDVADRWDATSYSDQAGRRGIGYNELSTAARDVWLSAEKAGLAFSSDSDWGVSRDSIPEIQVMERAFVDYVSMRNAAGHSDALAQKLSDSMRLAVEGTDRYFGNKRVTS